MDSLHGKENMRDDFKALLQVPTGIEFPPWSLPCTLVLLYKHTCILCALCELPCTGYTVFFGGGADRSLNSRDHFFTKHRRQFV